jgi:hypothetical protein
MSDRLRRKRMLRHLFTAAGRGALRRHFGYRVGVFSGATLHAFSSLSRRF